MCLIAIDWRPNQGTIDESHQHDDVHKRTGRPSLMLVANRDECYDRPTQAATYWIPGESNTNINVNPFDTSEKIQGVIHGGRDLFQGGTWLACSSNGRFAAITNYHEDKEQPYSRRMSCPRSRGEIISIFVSGRLPTEIDNENDEDGNIANDKPHQVTVCHWTAEEFAKKYLQEKLNQYGGFSVFLFDGKALVYCSNRLPHGEPFYRELPPGIYGLSNHLLDTPWPKVLKAKEYIAQARDKLFSNNREYKGKLDKQVLEELFRHFADTSLVCDCNAADVDKRNTDEDNYHHVKCSLCVRFGGKAGTRTTTVLCYDHEIGYEFIEKTHDTPFDKRQTCRENIPCYKNKTA